MIELEIKQSTLNDIYIPMFDNNTRFEIYYGGAGSGKSCFIAKKIIYKIMKNEKFNISSYFQIH